MKDTIKTELFEKNSIKKKKWRKPSLIKLNFVLTKQGTTQGNPDGYSFS